jgi:YhcH/YjgK/YiaL family protein
MIYDTLDQADRYSASHPGFAAGFAYLRKTDFSRLSPGRNEVDGQRMYLMLNVAKGVGKEKAKLEVHRQYIDIQLTLSGTDEIGWRPLTACTETHTSYQADGDYALYNDKPELWIPVPPKHFAIFFPGDTHAPMGAECDLRKAVLKVAVDWK